jgi:hypothetical protein
MKTCNSRAYSTLYQEKKKIVLPQQKTHLRKEEEVKVVAKMLLNL